MRNWLSAYLILIALLLPGCGGGKSPAPLPDPVPQAACVIEGIATSHELAPGTPGYAGDELTIEVQVSGETPSDIVWDFGGGAIPFGENPMASRQMELGLPGDYVGHVTAVDSAGLYDTFEFHYTVLPESHRIRSIWPSMPAGIVTQPIHFVADVDGEVEAIHWTFNSGTDDTESSDLLPLVKLTKLGTHTVTVRVTIRNGPTVTRDFPFTVVANPWTQFHTQHNQFLSDFLITSDGQVTLLLFDSNEVWRYKLLQVPVAELDTPALWQEHPFGELNPFGPGSLEEHNGHLGVLYVESRSTQLPLLSVSNSLHPTDESDWTFSQMGGMDDTRDAALVGADGSGWSALIHTDGYYSNDNEEMYWSTTTKDVPSTGDWTSGFIGDAPRFGTPSLVQHHGALISAVGSGSGTEIQIGQPGNIAALLSGPRYSIPGEAGTMLSNGERLMAITEVEEGVRLRLAFANRDVPMRSEDWTELPAGLFCDQQGRMNVQLTTDELIVTQPSFMGDSDFGPRLAMQLLRRPLNDLSVDWTREFVTEDIWISPWAFPTPDGMILAWRELNDPNDVVRWHQHAGG